MCVAGNLQARGSPISNWQNWIMPVLCQGSYFCRTMKARWAVYTWWNDVYVDRVQCVQFYLLTYPFVRGRWWSLVVDLVSHCVLWLMWWQHLTYSNPGRWLFCTALSPVIRSAAILWVIHLSLVLFSALLSFSSNACHLWYVWYGIMDDVICCQSVHIISNTKVL